MRRAISSMVILFTLGGAGCPSGPGEVVVRVPWEPPPSPSETELVDRELATVAVLGLDVAPPAPSLPLVEPRGTDGDGDGVDAEGPDAIEGTADDDCDDADATVYPDAPEYCDGVDNDCDELIDAADSDFEGTDADGDGDPGTGCGGDDCDEGDPAVDGVDADADGETSCAGDCDDLDPFRNTSANEACDGEDTDCDGSVDVGVVADADGDGHDAAGCGVGGDDCDDTDPAVFPDEDYTSGFVRDCLPAVTPGFASSWAHARLNLPSWFEDPVSGNHYVYFRGHHDPARHRFGYVTSADDGATWSAISSPLFDAAGGAAWDGRKISNPSVAYVPGATRPYVMAYHAQDGTTSMRRVGIATATAPGGDPGSGTFARLDLDGSTVSSAVLDVSVSGTAGDSLRVLHPHLSYDSTSGRLHLWYSGKGSGGFSLMHASCDVTTGCGSASDWDKTDSDDDGDPDVFWDATGWGGDARQPSVIDSPTGDGVEVWVSDGGSIGALAGALDDLGTWTDPAGAAVLAPSTDAGRFDAGSVTGRGVWWDAAEDAYVMVYGASVDHAVDGSGESLDALHGPGNWSGGASYLGRAVNHAPVVTINATCLGASGSVTDTAPDDVTLRLYVDGVLEDSPFSPFATLNTDVEVQTVGWSHADVFSGGSLTITVEATDAAGVTRSASDSVFCL